MLSSDILEAQFGPTKVEVLYQSDRERIICTKALLNDQTLELSWVRFVPEGTRHFHYVHEVICGGVSMGKAFRNAKIDFARENKLVTRLVLPKDFGKRFQTNEPATVVEVSILVGEKKLPYASILEVYSPVVKWPEPSTMTSKNYQTKIKQFAELLASL